MKNKIREFITNNNISFSEGERNSSITTIIGFSQYLNMSMQELKEALITEIEADVFIAKEIERLWKYCETKKYKKFWTTENAKSFKF